MKSKRLDKQIKFILEVDKLKQIFRQTLLIDRSRKENDAEHSWHLAVMALLLSEYANEESLDTFRVIKMLLIHDLVEIDAGDTFAYDEQAQKDKAERERLAAERLFNMLPQDQSAELLGLWREFEDMQTPEAQFAAALDRLQPLLHNYYTEGESWKEHGVTRAQVLRRNKHVRTASETLGTLTEALIEQAVEKGYLNK